MFLWTFNQPMTLACFREEVVRPYNIDFLDILDDRSQALSKVRAREQFAGRHDDKKDLDNSVDIRLKEEREDELIREEKLRMLGTALSKFVVLKLKDIQIRRQYLADVRFLDTVFPHLGKQASLAEHEELLFNEAKFVRYVS